MPNQDLTREFMLLRDTPDVEDSTLAELIRTTADATEAAMNAFRGMSGTVRGNAELSDIGKQKQMEGLAETTAAAIREIFAGVASKLEYAIGLRQAELASKASPAFQMPDLGVSMAEEYRAQEREARGLFREMLKTEQGALEVRTKLLEAAAAGDRQTMRVFLHAPTSFPLVDDATLQEAIETYAAATQPEAWNLLQQQKTALLVMNMNQTEATTTLSRMQNQYSMAVETAAEAEVSE